MKEYECLANWSLETDFKNSFSGMMRMNQDGLFFQTEKYFDGLYVEKIFGEKTESGIAKKNEKRKFTLIGCEELLSSCSTVRNFKVSSFVDGIHLDENKIIKSTKIYFSNLKDWLETDFHKCFRPSSPTGENLHDAKNYSVTLNLPEDIVLLENDKITIKIVFDNFYQGFILDKKFEECEPYIEMIISDDNSYRTYLEEIRKLRDFLTFATKTKVYVKELSVVSDEGFFRQYFFVPNSLLDTHDFYMLFPFSLFQDNKLHYGKWLKIFDSAPLEYENFFLALEQGQNSSFDSTKLKFIYLVQAAEAWKRCEKSDLLFSQAERDELDRVLGTINNQIVKKDKINSFVSSLRKKSDLSQKIFQLISEEKELLDSIHLRLDRNICNSIRDTRNYFAHLNPKKKDILTDEGLFWAAALLQVMMEIEFMKELGFAEDVIKDRVSDPQKGNIYRIYFAGSHFPVESHS